MGVLDLPTTIYEVAKLAGVSPATVSRVFNDSTLVSKKTKERVVEVAQQLGYTAISESEGRENVKPQNIAVLVSNILNPTLAQMVKGVQSYLKAQGYSMILFDSDGKVKDELDFLRKLKSHEVTGLVLSGPHFSADYIMALKQLEIPFVLAYTYRSDVDVPCVYINNVEASFSVVQQLFQFGHRHIGIIPGPTGDLTISRDRLQGCRLAFMGQGMQLSDDILVEGDYSVESGYAAAVTMIEQWDNPPTAIYAFSDMMAIGALNALQERGVRVPEDISIIGFDGIDFASLVFPSLSTVAQPSFQVGVESAHMLLKLLAGEQVPELKKEMPYEIVMRDSVARFSVKRPVAN